MFRRFVQGLFLFPALCLADIEGVYLVSDKSQMVVHFRDSQHIRVDMSDHSYVLISDAEVYAVTQRGEGLTAVDMHEMAGLSSMLPTNKSDATDWRSVKFSSTGKKQKVGGYHGLVYKMNVITGDKKSLTFDVVMSTHSDIIDLQKALVKMSQPEIKSTGLSNNLDFAAIHQQAEKNKIGGVLKINGYMELQSVKRVGKNVAFYQLPVEVELMKMPAIN